MPAGRLISIEGLDGTGKTTLAERLAGELAATGRRVELLREPGGAHAAERIRALVKDPEIRLDARAEALLYAAARAQLVAEKLGPALAVGTWVLLDRFTDSSLAYQGAGRKLGVEEVRAVNAFATRGLVPDRTFLLTVDHRERARRLAGRGEAPDRLELEPEQFFQTIARAYEELARAEPGRFVVLDAGLPPDALVGRAMAALEPLLAAGEARDSV